MKVFLDTNVILEYFTLREEFMTTQRMFERFHRGGDELFMSVGSFYTIVFLIDKVLRKETTLRGENRVNALRDILERILRTVAVAEHDTESLLRGVMNAQFKDVEDGCQYELARKAGCDVLVTFNTSDYPLGVNASVRVITPFALLDESNQ